MEKRRENQDGVNVGEDEKMRESVERKKENQYDKESKR